METLVRSEWYLQFCSYQCWCLSFDKCTTIMDKMVTFGVIEAGGQVYYLFNPFINFKLLQNKKLILKMKCFQMTTIHLVHSHAGRWFRLGSLAGFTHAHTVRCGSARQLRLWGLAGFEQVHLGSAPPSLSSSSIVAWVCLHGVWAGFPGRNKQ